MVIVIAVCDQHRGAGVTLMYLIPIYIYVSPSVVTL